MLPINHMGLTCNDTTLTVTIFYSLTYKSFNIITTWSRAILEKLIVHFNIILLLFPYAGNFFLDFVLE